MYGKKWVKIELKYFAKLLFMGLLMGFGGVVYGVWWGCGGKAFHGAIY
jgi:hypothetical protein